MHSKVQVEPKSVATNNQYLVFGDIMCTRGYSYESMNRPMELFACIGTD